MHLSKFYGIDPVPSAVHTMLSAQARFGALTDAFEAWVPEAWEDQDPVTAWFGKEPSQRLITIGKARDGSLYVLWCYESKTPETAPVCFLGGDGEGNTILAKNLETFWELLGSGECWGPYDGTFVPPDIEPSEEGAPRGPASFRSHFFKKHGPPRSAAEIRAEAAARHPDFAAFVASEVE